MQPRVFISAVTGELGQARQLAANVLHRLGYEAVWQDVFGTEGGDLRQMLRVKIDGCRGLIHLVGRAYGAEPPEPDAEFGRVSYTQYELLYARKKGKPTFVFFAEEGYPADRPPDQLDLPPPGSPVDAAAYQHERRQLQEAWRQRLRSSNELWHEAKSRAEFELKIERLKNDFDKWRRSFRIWQAAVLALLIALTGLVGMVVWNTHRLQPVEVKAQLVATIEAAYQRDLKQADSLPDWKRRDEARTAAVAWRDKRLAQVDSFVDSISQTITAGKASREYVELTRVLQENGVDEALNYIAAQEPRLLNQAEALIKARQEEVRTTLAPLLEKVRLLLTQGNLAAASVECDKLLALDPNWGAALHEKFLVLTALGDHAVLYSTLADALKQYGDASGTAARLAAISDPHADHDLLLSYYNLGEQSLTAARLPEATSYYRKYLQVAQKLAADPANTDAQRNLSIGYEILGDLSLRTDNVAAAIGYYKQDLEIVDHAAKAQPDDKQAQRDLMVSYQRLGEATKKSGDFPEAINLFSKSMNIAKSLAANPEDTRAQRELSVAYQRLGDASLAAGKPQDALAQYRSYLEIADRLAKADRNNEQAQRDLAVAYQRLGDASLQVKDLTGAIDDFRQSLRIAQPLAADPDNAVVQQTLWSAHTRLGHALSRRGDTAQAIAEFDAGQKIADAQLAKNADFFGPFDKACYETLKVLVFSLQHPQPNEDEKKTQQQLIGAAYRAVEALLKQPDYDVAQIRQEPDFSAVIGLPQFQGLLGQAARNGKQ